MGSEREEFFKKKKGQKKKRNEEQRERAPYKYLIVSEGEKTETNYFRGLKDKIQKKYNGTIDIKKRIELEIQGTGRNTNDLVDSVKEYILSIDQYINTASLVYGHVWVIFDKDDFKNQQFNSAITTAESSNYDVGWSNECFELWLLLHFENLMTGISREQYNDKLTYYFKKKKVPKSYFPDGKIKYDKNIKNIYELVCKYGDNQEALKRARNLDTYYKKQGQANPSYMNPCTKVYELVEELENYCK